MTAERARPPGSRAFVSVDSTVDSPLPEAGAGCGMASVAPQSEAAVSPAASTAAEAAASEALESIVQAAAKVVARAPEDEEKEQEKPPEDLELRAVLDPLREKLGRDVARGRFGNAVKILSRLRDALDNVKLHEMRQDVLVRAVGEELFCVFEAAGFQRREAVLAWQGQDFEEKLKSTIHEAQRSADLCLDPDTVTFAQVSELIQAGRTLPGIAEINDKVETNQAPKPSDLARPKKPWER